jgi:FkbM family methyltransferase
MAGYSLMIRRLVRAVPIGWWAPARWGVCRFRRGGLARGLCVALLKVAERAHRGRLPARLTEIRPLDAPELSFEPTDSMVMEAVYWFGVRGYEGRVASVWVALCGAAEAVLEIGGNVGLFTTIGGRARGGRYTVVEPLPEIAAVLAANLRRNGVAGVEVLTAAAVPDDSERPVRLSVPDERRAAPVGAHLVDDVEVSGRASLRVITVPGLPFRGLIAGRDLVKIDAEGIEAELLASARADIVARRPTLMVEVLPEATRLGALLAELAREAGYVISVIPQYGDDRIVVVPPADFTSEVPRRHRSKDVVLSVIGLPP